MIIRYFFDFDLNKSQKTSRKKLTKRCGMIDFSARQHGDGMKSPAADGLGRVTEAAGAGHPESSLEAGAIRRFQGNDYRKPPRVFRGRREVAEEQKTRRSDQALRGVVW